MSTVLVDGKSVKIHNHKCSNPNHSGSCGGLGCFTVGNPCGHSVDYSYVKLSSGTHRVEAYDTQGYWTITYVTIP